MRVLEVCRVGSWVALSVVFSGLWLVNPAVGAPVTVPTSLQAGDIYRLVFVTSTTHQATSSDINSYNTIVDELGDTAIASDWKVIGSTADVDAIDNTATPIATSGVSIWRLDNVKVADDYADLWDGVLLAPIRIEENLNTQGANHLVWTGANEGGVGLDAAELGATSNAIAGFSDKVSGSWIVATASGVGVSYHLYGMSSELTVEAAAVPEPSSAILLGVGVICVGWSRFRPKRRQASSTV